MRYVIAAFIFVAISAVLCYLGSEWGLSTRWGTFTTVGWIGGALGLLFALSGRPLEERAYGLVAGTLFLGMASGTLYIAIPFALALGLRLARLLVERGCDAKVARDSMELALTGCLALAYVLPMWREDAGFSTALIWGGAALSGAAMLRSGGRSWPRTFNHPGYGLVLAALGFCLAYTMPDLWWKRVLLAGALLAVGDLVVVQSWRHVGRRISLRPRAV